MKAKWQECFRNENDQAARRISVTINPRGDMSMSCDTWLAFAKPWFAVLLYDPATRQIGIRPAKPGTPNAFPVRTHGRSRTRFIYASRLFKQFNIKMAKTARFRQPKQDGGIWILELERAENARPSSASRKTKRLRGHDLEISKTKDAISMNRKRRMHERTTDR